MVIIVTLTASVIAGLATAVTVGRWPSADPAASASRAVEEEAADHRVTRFVRGRLDATSATGLALTVACAIVIAGAVVVGLLAYLIRAKADVLDVDAAVATWAHAHATGTSTALLRAITRLGSTPVVVGLAIVVGVLERRRRPSRSLWLFLALVVAGEILTVNLVKLAVARARPAIDPLAPFSGSSFPSGHSAAAAAAFAGFAMLLTRGRSARARAALAGSAAAIAVAVGMSRMLLGVHWSTDVAAGLAMGWAWFAVCAIAVGGRFLRFGGPVATGPPTAPGHRPSPTSPDPGPRSSAR